MKLQEEIVKQVEEVLKDHEYTCLVEHRVGDKASDFMIWRCQKPGTSIYGFDIVITKFGIAVMGDIDGLTFRVGSNYGIGFLAGDDVDYYIHSKLEHSCKTTEFDQDELKAVAAYEVAQDLSEKLGDELRLEEDEIPDWLRNVETARIHFDDVLDFLEERYVFSEYVAFLEEARNCYDAREGYECLKDAPFEISDFWEYRLEKPSYGLMFELYLINHAAKKIVEKIK